MVTQCYNTCFTISDQDNYFLVDAGGGNGILKQLKDSQIQINQINGMFISHTHTDHIMGAIWIIRAVGRKYLVEDYDVPFYIYGNDEVIKAIRKLCDAVLPPKFNELLDNNIKLIELKDRTQINILNKKTVFFDINAKKVKQYGFYMYLNENDKFIFIGDETCSEQTQQIIKDAKWLFADAYMAGQEAEKYDPIKRHHHSTVKFISELSQNLNIKNLILSHTVDTDLKNRKKSFTEDAKKYYKGNVFVPDDLEKIEL